MKTIIGKLPELSHFKPNDTEDDPYGLFYDWLENDIGEEKFNKIQSVTNVLISEEDYEEFKKIVEQWAKKKMSYLTKRKVDSSIAMYDLQNSPSTDKNLKKGEIRIKFENDN